jgi:hypothetical protein
MDIPNPRAPLAGPPHHRARWLLYFALDLGMCELEAIHRPRCPDVNTKPMSLRLSRMAVAWSALAAESALKQPAFDLDRQLPDKDPHPRQ